MTQTTTHPESPAEEIERLRRQLLETQQELAAREHELSESRERERATADILQVIASSPTDLQRVLDTICVAAMRLCETENAQIWLREADGIRLIAHAGELWSLTTGAQ